jgi:hypothetical protein
MFELKTERYEESVKRLPASGQQIIGYQDEHSIVVYQAYKRAISDFAVANQFFGGSDFSYSRMSWIKPNFLWMMFRCGWAEKENQEAVLAIKISKNFFTEILRNAVVSSFNADFHASHDAWKNELNVKPVRLQWDPDHDPVGNQITRRAIQLGLKGDILEKFGKDEILGINDITSFVKEQKKLLDRGQKEALMVPHETIFEIKDRELSKRIGILTCLIFRNQE